MFIEGNGSNLGVIWRNYQGGLTRQYLLCSYKNGVKTSYTNLRFNGNCSVLGVPDESAIPKIRLYPNPVQDQIFFKLPEGLKAEAVTVRNSTGKQLPAPLNATQNGLDCAGLAPGLYHLQIRLSGNKYFSGSFLKIP